MSHFEQLPSGDREHSRDYIDRWPLKIISTDVPGMPTTNHDDVMRFMAKYPGYEFAIRQLSEDSGREQLYMVALLPYDDPADTF